MKKKDKIKKGWIALSRGIINHWIWEDARRLKMWIQLLLLANYEDEEISIGNQSVMVRRGQFTSNIRNLSGLFGCAKQTTQNFISILEAHDMIRREIFPKYTIFTIVNFKYYQPHTDNFEPLEESESVMTVGRNLAPIEENNNKNNISLSPSSRATFEELCKELHVNREYWENTSKALDLSEPKLREMADDYIRERYAKQDYPRNMQAFREHLFNWLRKTNEIREAKERRRRHNSASPYSTPEHLIDRRHAETPPTLPYTGDRKNKF